MDWSGKMQCWFSYKRTRGEDGGGGGEILRIQDYLFKLIERSREFLGILHIDPLFTVVARFDVFGKRTSISCHFTNVAYDTTVSSSP